MKYTVIFLTIITALICRAFLVSVYKVPTQKMAPTILAGDYLFASKTAFGIKLPWSEEVFFEVPPDRGTLVVFTKNSKVFIKRVIAKAGDEVEFNQGLFFINSVKCNYDIISSVDPKYSLVKEACGEHDRWIYQSSEIDRLPMIAKLKLDKAHVFVANDYRNFELDAQAVEMISVDQIIGKPLFVWMSYSTTQDFISKSSGFRLNRILTKVN